MHPNAIIDFPTHTPAWPFTVMADLSSEESNAETQPAGDALRPVKKDIVLDL
jgi:hypothetical protein